MKIYKNRGVKLTYLYNGLDTIIEKCPVLGFVHNFKPHEFCLRKYPKCKHYKCINNLHPYRALECWNL